MTRNEARSNSVANESVGGSSTVSSKVSSGKRSSKPFMPNRAFERGTKEYRAGYKGHIPDLPDISDNGTHEETEEESLEGTGDSFEGTGDEFEVEDIQNATGQELFDMTGGDISKLSFRRRGQITRNNRNSYKMFEGGTGRHPRPNYQNPKRGSSGATTSKPPPTGPSALQLRLDNATGHASNAQLPSSSRDNSMAYGASKPIRRSRSTTGDTTNAAETAERSVSMADTVSGEDEDQSMDDEEMDQADSDAGNNTSGARSKSRHQDNSKGFVLPATRGPISNAPNHLLPSRDSGYKIHKRSINQPTKLTHFTSEISDASLKKRGLTRSSAPKMAKRAHGCNDPENVLIINMAENQGLRWGQIADFLNAARISTGRSPSLSANAVHNRYIRNAPLLYAAEGKPYIPLSKRDPNDHTRLKMVWNPDLDAALLEASQEIENRKWQAIADAFNGATGSNIDGKAAAFRFELL